jgi:hypothetical protein
MLILTPISISISTSTHMLILTLAPIPRLILLAEVPDFHLEVANQLSKVARSSAEQPQVLVQRSLCTQRRW